MGKRPRTTSRGAPARGPSKSKRTDDLAAMSDSDDDEIDAFHKQSDRIPFDVKRAEKAVKQIAGGDDSMDEQDEDGKNKNVWGRSKGVYYDRREQSGDDEVDYEEAQRIHKERVDKLSMKDFGFEDGESDEENVATKQASNHETKMKEDFSALPGNEKMDGTYSANIFIRGGGVVDTGDGVGLAHAGGGNPGDSDRLSQAALVHGSSGVGAWIDVGAGSGGGVVDTGDEVAADLDNSNGKMQPLVVKKACLLAYSQAITFYLLLKAEGLSVEDHPVMSRLVETKDMVEKMKQVTMNLAGQKGSIDDHNMDSSTIQADKVVSLDKEENKHSNVIALGKAKQGVELSESRKGESSNHDRLELNKEKEEHMGLQSLEMLKVRANLEERLKKRGLYNFARSKPEKLSKTRSTSNQSDLQTLDDFDDEVQKNNQMTKPNKLVMAATKSNKSKFVSGDDDLPKRDNIGERRRKHELRVLSRVGANSLDHELPEDGDDSEDEFYQDVKRQRIEKLSKKNEKYLLTPGIQPVEEDMEGDGKRKISYQDKHKNKLVKRKGQVRDIKKPSGPYGGEMSGINPNVSRSVRFKS
nr:unnamed protein product [Digitaria exilis]